MATWQDLIKAAMRQFQGVAVGETPTADEMQDGLDCLNRMLSSWRNERLMIYCVERHLFTLIPSQDITIGASGADWALERPIRIENAGVLVGADNEIPVGVIRSSDVWANIIQKTLTSTYPFYVYYQPTMPNGTLHYWPVPSVAYQATLYTQAVIEQVTDIFADVVLPPGYEGGIVDNLALQYAPQFGRSVSDDVRTQAYLFKRGIKITNSQPLVMRVPSNCPGGNHGWYDINSGQLIN